MEAEMAEEQVEMTEVEQVQEVSTTADDIEMMKAALKKANEEAAKFRHKVNEIERLKEEEAIAKSESLEELRAKLKAKEDDIASIQTENETYAEMVARYKERDEAELAALLEKVPDTLRETVSDETLPLAKRLDLAKKLVAEKPKGPDARPAGELNTDSLDEQLRQAQESGDVQASIALKRQIFEKKKG